MNIKRVMTVVVWLTVAFIVMSALHFGRRIFVAASLPHLTLIQNFRKLHLLF